MASPMILRRPSIVSSPVQSTSDLEIDQLTASLRLICTLRTALEHRGDTIFESTTPSNRKEGGTASFVRKSCKQLLLAPSHIHQGNRPQGLGLQPCRIIGLPLDDTSPRCNQSDYTLFIGRARAPTRPDLTTRASLPVNSV